MSGIAIISNKSIFDLCKILPCIFYNPQRSEPLTLIAKHF